MNLREAAATMTRSWLLIAAATVAGLAAGWAVNHTTQPSFTATSRVVVIAAEVRSPQDAEQLSFLIDSEMTLYHSLARSTPVTERVASRVGGVSAADVSNATAPVISEQILLLNVTFPDSDMASQTARVLAEEVSTEIQNLRPGQPQLIRAEPLDMPVVVSAEGTSSRLTIAGGAVLGLGVGLLLAWGVAALRPQVGSGAALGEDGDLVLRAEAEPVAYQQLAAILTPRLASAESVVLVGTGARVNLGPWVQGLGEQLGADACDVTAAPNGADPVALRKVSGGAVTVLVSDRRDPLIDVREAIQLLKAAGGNLAACLVVSESRG
ncbi:MAG: hypothetical protein Q4D79_13305 [Propionibacteriaceae bacterium]|nr:hypothetical protein [Propionibacteriaceae bacterium]